MFKNADEVLAAIEVKKRNGIDLKSFKAFMNAMGNPQYKLRCIHVGGTNGKGSTTNALRSILQCAGYTVGTFTSPYLETHHDRIRINNVFIADEVIVNYANRYYDAWIAYELSMFEIDMFIAVQYFLDNKVDLAVFEVGLGGEQDATNIVDPMVSVITNIGLDHMEFLGTTYASIAQAKAGIIKPDRALITSEQEAVCLDVFQQRCKQVNAQFITTQPLSNVGVDEQLHFTYRGFLVKQKTLANYQAINSALAIETICYLRSHNLVQVSDEQMLKGIYEAQWKGRFEVVHKHPLIILDGAHNEAGMAALVDSCRSYDKITVLFSALLDKPYAKMLDLLLTISDDVRVCAFDFPRAASAQMIAQEHPVKIVADYRSEIRNYMEEQNDGVLLICGSLYFISEVRNEFFKKGESTL